MFLVGFIFDILLILSLTSKRKAVISKRRATDFKFLLDVIGNFRPKWFSFAEAQTLLAGGARRSPIWPGVTSAADILGGKRWHVDEDHVKPTRAGNGHLAPPLDDSLTKQLARLQPCVTLLFFFFLLALALISGAPTAGTLLGSSSKCEVKLMAKKLDNKIQPRRSRHCAVVFITIWSRFYPETTWCGHAVCKETRCEWKTKWNWKWEHLVETFARKNVADCAAFLPNICL